MALRSCDDISPDGSAETQLRLPAPLRDVMEADEDNVIHCDVEGTDSPSTVGPHSHRLLAHGIHELLDGFCDDFGQLFLCDHATFASVISRRDLFVARLVPWPLYSDSYRRPGRRECRLVPLD